MSDISAGGYHWLSEKRAEYWDSRERELTAEREYAFSELIEALGLDTLEPFRFVDLGAGDGKVATLVLEHYPNAFADLVDFSAPMMERGTKAMKRFAGRYRYEFWDMNSGEWPAPLEGPFAAVVSSAAIHHLDNERKSWLSREVLRRLLPGGVFANYDLFRDPAADFDDDEVHDRACATLVEALGFLRDAGFAEISARARSPRPAGKSELALVVGRAGR